MRGAHVLRGAVALLIILAPSAILVLGLWGVSPLSSVSAPPSGLGLPVAGYGSPTAQALYSFYTQVVGGMVGGRYSEVEALLLNSSYIRLPPAYTYTFHSFNSALYLEASTLNQTLFHLNLTRAALNAGNLSDAVQYAGEAASYLQDSNTTYTQIQLGVAQVGGALGAPNLGGVFSPIGGVIQAYQAELDGLLGEIRLVEMGALEPTTLTLSVVPGSVWVGGVFNVSGRLTTLGGQPIGGATINIIVGGEPPVRAVTDGGGGYSLSLRAPFVYKPNVSVLAVFASTSKYFGSSARGALTLLYYKPSLDVVLTPPVSVPGGNVSLVGVVSGCVGGSKLGVKSVVYSGVFDVVCGENFSVLLGVPADASAGFYALNVSVLPNGWVGPATSILNLTVHSLPLNVDVSAPLFVVAGFGGDFRGVVGSGGVGLSGVNVTLSGSGIGGLVGVTGGGGVFNIHYTPSLLTSSGRVSLTLGVEAGPKYASKPLSVVVYVLNPLDALIPAIGVYAAVDYFHSQRRRLGVGASPPTGGAGPSVGGGVGGGAAPIGGLVTRQGGSAIGRLYAEAAEVVGGLTGVRIAASDTVREYLGRVRPSLGGGVLDAFSALTLMVELELYAGVAADLDEARRLLEAVGGGGRA
ncbi:MAG: DUF4129 domain-containing protein [Thermoprotei archaeon]